MGNVLECPYEASAADVQRHDAVGVLVSAESVDAEKIGMWRACGEKNEPPALIHRDATPDIAAGVLIYFAIDNLVAEAFRGPLTVYFETPKMSS
jgi:hypothetical protein